MSDTFTLSPCENNAKVFINPRPGPLLPTKQEKQEGLLVLQYGTNLVSVPL